VGFLMEELCLSERRSCRIVGLSRSAQQYRPAPRNDAAVISRLKELASENRRYGYLRLHAMLRREGLVANRKRTYRLYTEEGLQVRTKKRRKLPRRDRVAPQAPERPMQRWSLDFVSDQLADFRRFRVLNIVDDHSRFCPGQIVDVSISGARMARYLDELALAARPAGGDRPRQRAGRDQSRHVRMVGAHGRPSALHRTWQAGPERLRREPKRSLPRRVPEPALVPIAPSRSRRDRTLAPPLQHQAPALRARLSNPD
jgi:hypothetical protein